MALARHDAVSEPSTSSYPSPHTRKNPQQESANPLHMSQGKERRRLPRVPHATDDCRYPWTRDQVYDWLNQFYELGRAGFQSWSECDDYIACVDLQNIYSIDFPSDTEEDEDEAAWIKDLSPPPVQLYRTRPQRPLSPPRTPPHLKGTRLHTSENLSSALKPNAAKVEKSIIQARSAPRRPVTRSQGGPLVSLHHRKGYVRCWRVYEQYTIISYDKFLREIGSNLHLSRGSDQLD